MARLKTDSPLSRRIVLSFLDFLNLVEPASGVDLEGLEVAKECLAEVFEIDPSADDHSKPDSLIDIFTSWKDFKQSISESDLKNEGQSLDAHHTSPTADANIAEQSQPEARDWTRGGHALDDLGNQQQTFAGLSKDELLGQFFGALEKIHYFRSMPDGHDDQAQLDRASNFLHNAIMEMEKSGCKTFDQRNLAETFKSQGNKAMQSKLYYDAIELYTFAIALCEDNAVYHCNRAAAYTQINKYAEAIRDCQKSIEIDPNYSKAYSRLGFAYYAQGNYRDAIDKGFKKALQLDPSNDSVKENIQVAEQRLREEQQRAEHDQNSSSASHHGQSYHQSSGESRGQDTPSPFTSMPFSANGIPADITSMLMNIAGNVYQGQNLQDRAAAGNNSDSFNDPGIRVGGNFNVNLGEQVPEELSGALRSVMEMFTGGGPRTNSEDDGTGRSASS